LPFGREYNTTSPKVLLNLLPYFLNTSTHITKILLKYQYRNFLNNKDLKYTHIAHVSYYTSLVSKLENDLLLRYKYDEGGILC